MPDWIRAQIRFIEPTAALQQCFNQDLIGNDTETPHWVTHWHKEEGFVYHGTYDDLRQVPVFARIRDQLPRNCDWCVWTENRDTSEGVRKVLILSGLFAYGNPGVNCIRTLSEAAIGKGTYEGMKIEYVFANYEDNAHANGIYEYQVYGKKYPCNVGLMTQRAWSFLDYPGDIDPFLDAEIEEIRELYKESWEENDEYDHPQEICAGLIHHQVYERMVQEFRKAAGDPDYKIEWTQIGGEAQV